MPRDEDYKEAYKILALDHNKLKVQYEELYGQFVKYRRGNTRLHALVASLIFICVYLLFIVFVV